MTNQLRTNAPGFVFVCYITNDAALYSRPRCDVVLRNGINKIGNAIILRFSEAFLNLSVKTLLLRWKSERYYVSWPLSVTIQSQAHHTFVVTRRTAMSKPSPIESQF